MKEITPSYNDPFIRHGAHQTKLEQINHGEMIEAIVTQKQI